MVGLFRGATVALALISLIVLFQNFSDPSEEVAAEAVAPAKLIFSDEFNGTTAAFREKNSCRGLQRSREVPLDGQQ